MPYWFMQKKRVQRKLIATLFTIQIIQKGHATSGGRTANARLNTKRTGTLSAGVFVFTSFTACRCSRNTGQWPVRPAGILPAACDCPRIVGRRSSPPFLFIGGQDGRPTILLSQV